MHVLDNPRQAGVCALIMSAAMASNKTTQLGVFAKEVLLYSADRIPGLEGTVSRGSRVNALNSLRAVQEGIMPPYPYVPPSSWTDFRSPLNLLRETWGALVDSAASFAAFLLSPPQRQ
jgi:hypothetical protein